MSSWNGNFHGYRGRRRARSGRKNDSNDARVGGLAGGEKFRWRSNWTVYCQIENLIAWCWGENVFSLNRSHYNVILVNHFNYATSRIIIMFYEGICLVCRTTSTNPPLEIVSERSSYPLHPRPKRLCSTAQRLNKNEAERMKEKNEKQTTRVSPTPQKWNFKTIESASLGSRHEPVSSGMDIVEYTKFRTASLSSFLVLLTGFFLFCVDFAQFKNLLFRKFFLTARTIIKVLQ